MALEQSTLNPSTIIAATTILPESPTTLRKQLELYLNKREKIKNPNVNPITLFLRNPIETYNRATSNNFFIGKLLFQALKGCEYHEDVHKAHQSELSQLVISCINSVIKVLIQKNNLDRSELAKTIANSSLSKFLDTQPSNVKNRLSALSKLIDEYINTKDKLPPRSQSYLTCFKEWLDVYNNPEVTDEQKESLCDPQIYLLSGHNIGKNIILPIDSPPMITPHSGDGFTSHIPYQNLIKMGMCKYFTHNINYPLTAVLTSYSSTHDKENKPSIAKILEFLSFYTDLLNEIEPENHAIFFKFIADNTNLFEATSSDYKMNFVLKCWTDNSNKIAQAYEGLKKKPNLISPEYLFNAGKIIKTILNGSHPGTIFTLLTLSELTSSSVFASGSSALYAQPQPSNSTNSHSTTPTLKERESTERPKNFQSSGSSS